MQKGLNNQKIQQTNRSLILEMIIDRGIVTRKEMIDLTGLHKPTITNIVNELLEMNVIEECEVPRKEGQRKVVGFALKTQKIKILSARWARDFFEVALYTLSEEIIDSERCAVNPEEEIELTANKNLAAIYRLLERHHTSHVLGMCIGVPGPYIKAEKNQALVAGYDNLQKIDIQKYFEDKFPFPVITEHDAHLSAFAEWKSMSQNERNKYNCMLALQSLGIGIGAGVILNGKIVEGAFGVSGEIGQMGILFSGVKNSQGARGKLENYASSSSVKKYVRTRLFEFPESELSEESSYDQILQAYYENDPLAVWAFDVIAWHLAYGLANTIFVINPGIIIIGPDYPKAKRFTDKIKQALNGLMDERISSRIEIRYSEIDKDPTLEGGYRYVVDMFIRNRMLFERVSEIMGGHASVESENMECN